jgi:probable phosphoglycerate mutase
MKLIVEADGGSRGNPGPAGFGALVRDASSGEVLAEVFDSLGVTTNNVAEYNGLIAGLRAAADLAPGADVDVRMDSKLVVEQMSGRWQIKHPALRPLAAEARAAARRLGRITYQWMPRAQNAHADRLANQAMDAAAKPASAGQPPGQQPGPRPAPRPGPGWTAAHHDPLTTVLLRHGQTPLSAERRFAGRGDIPLTETGELQAKAAAQRLGARGGIDRIVTSPLQRARRTAEAVAAATGAPVEVDDGWLETDFGAWEGLSYAEAMERWPDEMSAWMADTSVAPPGGESFVTTSERVLAALDRLLGGREPGTVVVVSHVTPMKTVLRHALLAPPAALRRMYLDVACLCEIDWYADGPGVVRTFNDTGHLQPR